MRISVEFRVDSERISSKFRKDDTKISTQSLFLEIFPDVHISIFHKCSPHNVCSIL